MRIRNLVSGAILALTSSAFAQSNLQFVGGTPTSEGAVRITWNSTANEVYQIEYADEVVDFSEGGPVWNTLVTDYPSQGTTTTFTDAGNYDLVPEIAHPKKGERRFYRVRLLGTNTSPTNPTVSITSPTTGTSMSGEITVTVAASSTEFLSDVRLYVDGEPQWRSDDGVNFVINTCEWPNGPHTLFATAKSQSGIEGSSFGDSVTFGRSVSTFVNVTFDNLIERFDFSEPYFEPEEGQTQIVTAHFTSNSDWTLLIQDAANNTVRTAEGRGSRMEFDWTGENDNGAQVPAGVYSYSLSAVVNGLPPDDGGTGGGATPPPPGMQSMSMTTDSSDTTPLPPLPPGLTFDPADLDAILLPIPESPINVSAQNSQSLQIASVETTETAFVASSQATKGPKRKPKVGVKSKTGTFGICYQTYPLLAFLQQPQTHNPLSPFTGVDGGARSPAYISWSKLPSHKAEADVFAELMKFGGLHREGVYKPKFIKGDEKWKASDITKGALGGSSIFNTCNFGLLMTHGCYGTNPEIDGIKYTYLALWDEKNGGGYVRLSDLDLGSSGPDGLRWMTILSCNMLFPDNVTSMRNNSKWPVNDNLHLLLGATTLTAANAVVTARYATNLLSGLSIADSFTKSGTDALAKMKSAGVQGLTYAIAYRVMGYQSCIGDTLWQYNDPDETTQYRVIDTPVFTP